MAIVKQGGGNPHRGQVMTSMGLRAPRPPLCRACGERKDGIYTVNPNGQVVCPDCVGEKDRDLLSYADTGAPVYGEAGE